jgi:hypothetical protein
VLSSKSLEKYAITIPEWQNALRRYLKERVSQREETES